jgi:hypothetical protein
MVSIEQISPGMRREWKSEANEGCSSKIAFSILNADNNRAKRSNSIQDNSSSPIGTSHPIRAASIRSELIGLNPYLIEPFLDPAT